jgi:hypothetical protein
MLQTICLLVFLLFCSSRVCAQSEEEHIFDLSTTRADIEHYCSDCIKQPYSGALLAEIRGNLGDQRGVWTLSLYPDSSTTQTSWWQYVGRTSTDSACAAVQRKLNLLFRQPGEPLGESRWSRTWRLSDTTITLIYYGDEDAGMIVYWQLESRAGELGPPPKPHSILLQEENGE